MYYTLTVCACNYISNSILVIITIVGLLFNQNILAMFNLYYWLSQLMNLYSELKLVVNTVNVCTSVMT